MMKRNVVGLLLIVAIVIGALLLSRTRMPGAPAGGVLSLDAVDFENWDWSLSGFGFGAPRVLSADFTEPLVVLPVSTAQELITVDGASAKQPLRVCVERGSGFPPSRRVARYEWFDASGATVGKGVDIELVLERVEEHQVVYLSTKPILMVGSLGLAGEYPFGTALYAPPGAKGGVALLDP